MRSLCAERAAPVQARSRRVSTIPPAAATPCASDGVRRTAITRRHAAHDRDSAPAVLPRRLANAPDERAHERALVRGGEVGAAALQLLRAQLAGDVEERRLEAGEREVEPGHARDRKVEGRRISL